MRATGKQIADGWEALYELAMEGKATLEQWTALATLVESGPENENQIGWNALGDFAGMRLGLDSDAPELSAAVAAAELAAESPEGVEAAMAVLGIS